jgi:uncharacterized peroxidase-related enzyme
MHAMPHINLPADAAPGISGLLVEFPETGRPLRDFVEVLLRGSSTLSQGEREIIASSVSWWNDCHFCHASHGAAAAACLGADFELLDDIKAGLEKYPATPKLRALLAIARHVQQGGKQVTAADVAAAREQGATDREVHDAVLIAAAFCMFNRYVDGLATRQPNGSEPYREVGVKIANEGYLRPFTPQTPPA